uniref:Uncharacterized protein n=1 Tax=viral metagenome TaxID=1070528 RepID=A0A6M3M238_9ZZZZ
MVLTWQWKHPTRRGGEVVGDKNTLDGLMAILGQQPGLAFIRLCYLGGIVFRERDFQKRDEEEGKF